MASAADPVVEVLIVGAGIIGAALACAFAADGVSVQVLESGLPGAATSAAGMGHLVVLDHDPGELALSQDGLKRWQALRPQLPDQAEFQECGTLWLAGDDAEREEARRKRERLAAQGIESRWLDATELYRLEPALAPGLIGALRNPCDAVLYPPAATAWLLERAVAQGAVIHTGIRATRLSDRGVIDAQGRHHRAQHCILANALGARDLVAGLPLAPRKGQLAITTAATPLIRHQLVELGYVKRAHQNSGSSLAFNLQPRARGQILVGSSRANEDADAAIDWPLLAGMLGLACDFVPALANRQILRCWTGLRPATPDGRPLLGRVPGRERHWLATGHEGLGITTALSSAALLRALIRGEAPEIDPHWFAPERFAEPSPHG